jgi:hypothetical protein
VDNNYWWYHICGVKDGHLVDMLVVVDHAGSIVVVPLIASGCSRVNRVPLGWLGSPNTPGVMAKEEGD